MTIRGIRHLSFSVLFALVFSSAVAQYRYVNPTFAWKKQVARIIDIPEKKGSSAHAGKRQKTLYQMIVDACKAGDIPLYANSDQNFSVKLTREEGAAIAGLNNRIYRPVPRYRILEDWSFDPTTCKTEIQITGIAPIREIYDSDGTYRGRQAMFWIRYNDLRKVLARDEQLHGSNSLTNHIWNDYFSQDTVYVTKDEWRKTSAIRTMDIPDNSDTIAHHLRVYSDSSLVDMIMNLKRSGIVSSFADDDFTTTLHKWGIIDQWLDTLIITDPVSDKEVKKYMPHGIHNFGRQQYNILESWRFNPVSGKTEIEITGLAPAVEITGNNDYFPKIRPQFWVKYEDVQEAISKYDQYQPGNSFALHIWDSYFLSDIKPVKKTNSAIH